MVAVAQPEPLQRFFGAYKPTEAEMRQVLEDAAEEAERLIPKLLEKHTTSSKIKAAQLSLILREVRAQQGAMWADLGPVIRNGMERASLAAVAGENIIDQYLARNGMDMPDLRASFRAQAMRGFRNVLAKGANGLSLSRQVYRTEALANGWVDRVVRKALILQTSAKDLAKQVRQYIDPNVKGGVSFAAFRLARTELNNAFHTVAKERLDEPWSRGIEWHLSGSHPPHPPGKPEICEKYASADRGLGTGIWLPKDVPDKPHPQCLCYITQHVVSEDEFIDNLLGGNYDEYLGHRAEEDPPKKDPALLYLEATAGDPANKTATLVNDLITKFGVKRDDAKAMVQVYRPTGKKPPRKPAATVVPLRPEDRPAKPATGTPGQWQHAGSIRPATELPKTTPDQPAPSQPSLVVKAHIQRITKFTGKKQERVRKALERQGGYTPKTILKLNEVAEMDRRAPSFGEAGVVGEYDDRHRIMFLHPSAFLAGAQRVFEHEKKTKYISECGQQFDSLDNLIAHEYGHHVHDRWLMTAPAKQRKRIVDELCLILGVDPPLHHDTNSLMRWGTKHQIAIANRVSKYGSTNILEMMAEVWAEYTLGDPPRTHIREMGEVLRDAAEEHS